MLSLEVKNECIEITRDPNLKKLVHGYTYILVLFNFDDKYLCTYLYSAILLPAQPIKHTHS